MVTNNNWAGFTNNVSKLYGVSGVGETTFEEARKKAINMAGDGTNMDGQTKQISVDGYNFILVNKGGVWKVSSSQNVG